MLIVFSLSVSFTQLYLTLLLLGQTPRPNLKKDFLNKWGRLDTNIHVFINKDDLTQAGLEKKVKDGDEVKIVYTRKTGC